jgi:hypothetical protein
MLKIKMIQLLCALLLSDFESSLIVELIIETMELWLMYLTKNSASDMLRAGDQMVVMLTFPSTTHAIQVLY